jgi:serine/threonine protein kinase
LLREGLELICQITIYEILIGRTPFEENEEEDFQDPDQYLIYYERTRKGDWLGQYNMPDGQYRCPFIVPLSLSSNRSYPYLSTILLRHEHQNLADDADLQHLIRSMVCPDPAFRITAMQAYHHPALQPAVQAVFVTPSFVREATHPDVEEDPLPPIPYEQSRPHSHHTLAAGNSHTHTYAQGAGEEVKRKKIKVKKTKDRTTVNGHHQSTLGPRSATPTALGESIKQHTSAAKPKRDNDKVKSGHGHGKGKGREDIENASNHNFDSPKKGSKLVIKNMNHRWSDVKADEEDPTRESFTCLTILDSLGQWLMIQLRRSRNQLNHSGSRTSLRSQKVCPPLLPALVGRSTDECSSTKDIRIGEFIPLQTRLWPYFNFDLESRFHNLKFRH